MAFASISLANAEEQRFKNVYKAPLPWDGSYSIRLEIPEGWNDPGEFTRLRILKGEQVALELKDLQANPIHNVDQFPKGSKKIGKYLRNLPLNKSGKESAIALANWIGGSSHDELILLVNDGTSPAYEAFRQSIALKKIADFDGDGKYDLLSRGGKGEPGEGYFSYEPFLVFKQSKKNGRIAFEIDEELSKKWSAENHFEWHGAKYDSKIRVDERGKVVSP